MANKALFGSTRGAHVPAANTMNEAGGLAYSLSAQHGLAQLSATGCLNATYYASAQDQLDAVLRLCEQVEPEFIARTALYTRKQGFMKDLPALMCAVLSVKSPGLMAEIFDRVIDNPRMLRNFVQIMRSGVVGRKSLGSLPKRMVLQWLASRSDKQLFFASVGKSPSLVDVIKMVHPKPATQSRAALYGYLLGRPYEKNDLAEIVVHYERFKDSLNSDGKSECAVPEVPFQMLTALKLSKEHWKDIARTAPWQMTRMNLNTFQRHGVFEDRGLVKAIATRLRDRKAIARSRVFPYQLLMAYRQVQAEIPGEIRNALQDALEIAIENVPAVDGTVYVLPDISGSMHSAATGYRRGATSAVRCIDIAALVAAAMVRKNPTAEVIPFESKAITSFHLNSRDSVMTNADKLTKLPAGGTNCSAPLVHLNKIKAKGDLIIYVSDNESWLDSPNYGRFGGVAPTETMKQWATFKQRNPRAKMICIDIQPNTSTQAKERDDIVNVGGFSDQVFKLIGAVTNGGTSADHWVREIDKIDL